MSEFLECVGCKAPLYIDSLDTELGTFIEVLFCLALIPSRHGGDK